MKLQRSDPVGSSKAILGFVIMILALAVFAIFNINKDNIIESDSFQPFMILTVVFMGFLLGLLYFASQTKTAKATRSVKPAKKKKR